MQYGYCGIVHLDVLVWISRYRYCGLGYYGMNLSRCFGMDISVWILWTWILWYGYSGIGYCGLFGFWI